MRTIVIHIEEPLLAPEAAEIIDATPMGNDPEGSMFEIPAAEARKALRALNDEGINFQILDRSEVLV